MCLPSIFCVFVYCQVWEATYDSEVNMGTLAVWVGESVLVGGGCLLAAGGGVC